MSESLEIYKLAEEVTTGKKPTQSLGLGQTVHIPLRDAYICASCDVITNSSVVCPGCADTSLMPLSTLVESIF